MTEIHTYRCDVCGKTFNDEEDCREHELKCKTTGLEKSVVMMDSLENIIPLNDWRKALDRAYFIYIANQETADKLQNLFYEYNYSFPTEDAQEAVLYPALFAYEDNGMYWKSLQDVENEYNELLAVKDKMEDLLH